MVAPALIASPNTTYKNSGSERPASSGENSTSAHNDFAYETISLTRCTTSSGSIFNLCFMWMGDVARKVWMRGFFAPCTASQALSMSALLARAKPAMTGTRASDSGWAGLPTSTAMRLTASRSSGEAAGKPASMTSTPRRARLCATSNFSAEVIVAPGDCSPSRKVVSKILT